jgi:chorismate mutase
MSLIKIRERIDVLDKEILEKLNDRFELALQTKALKSRISDRMREMQVLEKARDHSRKLELINSNFAAKIFLEVIKESRKVQKEKK